MKRFLFLIPTVLLLILLPLGLQYFSHSMGQRVSAESLQVMRTALNRAAVECYALEGFYPPELSYLTGRYGVSVDEEIYYVDYAYTGSNLMPDITVLPATGGGSGHG